MNRIIRSTKPKARGRYALTMALLLLAAFSGVRPARAQCQYLFCEPLFLVIDLILFPVFTNATESTIDDEISSSETDFMPNDFFKGHLGKGMSDMTLQFEAAGMAQMMEIGAFFDAQDQLQTQHLFQQKIAQAHKDYQPSADMCAIGTAADGIGTAFHNGETTAILLGEHSRNRQMFAQSTVSNSGDAADITGRLSRLQKRYCDPNDDNLSQMCQTSAPATSVNKDVDFMRTVYEPLTLNADFAATSPTDDEQNVLALSDNLYANRLFPKVAQQQLNQPGNQGYILDWRSVVAKRSVAENSFNAIVGLKTADTTQAASNAKYLEAVLQEMGASHTDAAALIGAQPSYYARMELLTKKIYEQPQFYTNLYDTPANVARKGAALRAIDLMQHMDMFNSQLRNEAILAELVELDVIKEQSRVQNNINPLVSGAGR